MERDIIQRGRVAARKVLEDTEALVEDMEQPRRAIFKTSLRSLHVGQELGRMCGVVPGLLAKGEKPTEEQIRAVAALNNLMDAMEDTMRLIEDRYPWMKE